MAVKHSKVWESLLVAGGIIFSFGVIWGAFLIAQYFAAAQGAIVLIVVGIILLVTSETMILTMNSSKGKR